jgi:thioester reductase-like protein
MGDRIHLVTGYPGFLGKRLVRRLLTDPAERPRRLVCLVQQHHLEAARADLAQLPAPEAESRLAAQLPVAEKAARADVVVDNGDEAVPLGPKAARLLEDLRGGLGRRLPSAPPRRY